MPHHPLHKQKKYKNYTLLGLLLGLIALFFALTIVKIKESNQRTVQENISAHGNLNPTTESQKTE